MSIALNKCEAVTPVPVPGVQGMFQRLRGANRLQQHVLNCPPDNHIYDPSIMNQLDEIIQNLRVHAMDASTGQINYDLLREQMAYAAFRDCVEQLVNFDLNSLQTYGQKVAFWINLYNVVILDAVIQFGVQQSVQEMRGFFLKTAYVVGGYRFSADDIEHGILRANAGYPALPGTHFHSSDPRTKLMLSTRESRVHFALNCGASSCPPIRLYRADDIENQLELAARSFINSGGVRIDMESRVVHLAKVFSWYAPDFGGNLLNQIGAGRFWNVLRFIAPYVDDEAAGDALATEPESFSIKIVPYDWKLNALQHLN